MYAKVKDYKSLIKFIISLGNRLFFSIWSNLKNFFKLTTFFKKKK